MLGHERETRFDKENTLASIDLLERAVRLDPRLARAWTVLGWAYYHAHMAGWTEDRAGAYAAWRATVLKAAELDPDDGIVLEELGSLRAEEGDIAGAKEAFERALEVGRNHADVLALTARYVATVLGREDEALQLMRKAFRLNPLAPDWYFLNLVRVAYFTREFQTVVEAARRATDFLHKHLFNALALAQLGRSDEATRAAAALRARYPEFDAEAIIRQFPLLHPPAVELYREGLRKAGL